MRIYTLLILYVCIFCFTVQAQQFARTADRQNSAESSFSADSVQVKWKTETGGKIFSSPIVSDGILYIGSCDSNLYALDKNNGNILWRYKTGGEVRSSVAIDGGIVYFLSGDGVFYALNAKEGILKWQFKTGGEQLYDMWDYFQSSPTVRNETVYFGSGDHHIYALNSQDGSLRWRYKTGGIVHASPALSEDAILVGSFDGYFYCLEENGDLRWKFNTLGEHYFRKGEVQFNATIADSSVYFGARDFNLYALKIKDGSGHWVYHQQGSWVSIPSIARNRLIATMSDSFSILVMGKTYGNIEHSPWVPLNVFSSASLSDSSAYFGAIDGVLYHLNISTGVVTSIFQTDASKKNRINFFNTDGLLRDELLSLYNDDFMQAFLGYYDMGSIFSTVWLDQKSIYFASTDGYIYALE
ncbi:PQQ-binding-like beta-propeller repeat protein [Sphingobacterium sp. UT-1RO-CII-1]|uniref:PQQ-binding-like beta-propeller repeat protein n=1 Tax=Sphingobacterium sp. UT-1RO-CII-1 TaxID=2995225 RepID=UPI00227ADF2B|nr:PQQ-binding-like beta-propeller repeat protein [Sphingobacterium sp. UT-1RO-CII-1]MCY4779391.1 PQQ-binding-like beta-propeller repeat protein [Sphingobacterium sp. UT-1RO-CII-1]